MGEAYRATDTRLGRDVALKVLPAEMASSPERLDRFRREARAVAGLNPRDKQKAIDIIVEGRAGGDRSPSTGWTSRRRFRTTRR